MKAMIKKKDEGRERGEREREGRGVLSLRAEYGGS